MGWGRIKRTNASWKGVHLRGGMSEARWGYHLQNDAKSCNGEKGANDKCMGNKRRGHRLEIRVSTTRRVKGIVAN